MFVHLLAMFVHWNLKGIICSFLFNKHVNLHLIVTERFGGQSSVCACSSSQEKRSSQINTLAFSLYSQVLIRVIDTNNHRPQFSEKWYEVNVSEDKPPGTEVLQINAADRDEKNKLTFTLLSSTDPFSLRKFRLDPGTGTLYTAESLDHETMHRHILTVMVRISEHWRI